MYNKVIMVGRLTRDIELKYIPSGAAIAKSSIASNHTYKTQTGEKKEEVCFLDFDVFGKSAEILNQYVRKGSQVLLEGRLVLNRWTAQDGTNRSNHTLRVETFKFLDSKGDSSDSTSSYNQSPQQQYNQPQGGMSSQNVAPVQQSHSIPEIDINTDEIPF
jgi:single-strand DNA-binding protein